MREQHHHTHRHLDHQNSRITKSYVAGVNIVRVHCEMGRTIPVLLPYCFFLFLICICQVYCSPDKQEFVRFLDTGIEVVNEQMSQIESAWEVQTFPSFLNSCGMTKASWEMLKTRFLLKILSARTGANESFIVSFMVSKFYEHFFHKLTIA